MKYLNSIPTTSFQIHTFHYNRNCPLSSAFVKLFFCSKVARSSARTYLLFSIRVGSVVTTTSFPNSDERSLGLLGEAGVFVFRSESNGLEILIWRIDCSTFLRESRTQRNKEGGRDGKSDASILFPLYI